MRKRLPNIITLLNLFCGCCALFLVFRYQYEAAFVFVFLGGLADYMDGLVARWLKVDTVLGKELDSLADMVTFGLVPGAILYTLLAQGIETDPLGKNSLTLGALPAFVLTLFSALRLAKFNLDTRQSDDFIGMPTPSSTVFVLGLMLIYEFDSFGLRTWVSHPIFLYVVVAALSFLLVAEIPMTSLKFKNSGWKGNERRYILLILGLGLLVGLRELGLSLIIFLYALFSIIDYYLFNTYTK
ncbi:MAG: CDP-alcohol phosphatidyltransferase family protein [Bacteroidota bacterium]